MNIRRPIAAALAHALLLGTVALPPVLAPAPAVAQGAQAQRTVAGIRLLGEWQYAGHRFEITEAAMGRVRFRGFKPDGQEIARGELAPYGNRWAMAGDVTVGPAETPKGKGRLALFVTPDGKFEGWNLEDVLELPWHLRDRLRLLQATSRTTLPAAEAAQWSGEWRTTRGLLMLAPERNHLAGAITHGEGARQFETVALIPGGGVAVGAWGTTYDNNTNEQKGVIHWGDVTLRLSPDGKTFSGWYTEVSGGDARRIEWSGERLSAGSGAGPTAGQAALVSDLVGGDWREASGQSFWRFTKDSKGVLTGLTWHQVDTAETGGAPLIFSPAPDGKGFTAPGRGGQWVLGRDGSGRLTLKNDHASTQLIRHTQASSPSQPAPGPSQPPPARPTPAPSPGPAPAPAADGFQPLEKWDVRVDRVENPRDDRLTHVYLTLRNSGTGPLVQTQGVSVRHEDGDGVVTESGQGLRAKPGYPELFGSPPPVVLPGREIKTKFVFDRNGGTARITVVEGKATADFDF